MTEFERLSERVSAFVEERDWAKFHTPKNLAMCLSVEASELVELYQWQLFGEGATHPGAGAPPQSRVEEEVGDVLISLINFCNATGIDPIEAAMAKLERVKLKYPVESIKGSAERPTEIS
tara:strand:+ start:404 stop:763 length:360 start_codon:yes stop_codon:yes gene_type:complete